MKKNKFESFVTAKIPHLRATVHFADMSKLQGIEKKGAGFTCEMGDDIYVFIENIKENSKKIEWTPIFAHEIVHVLQVLCKKSNMDLETESEHTAYLMSYLMEKVLGFSRLSN